MADQIAQAKARRLESTSRIVRASFSTLNPFEMAVRLNTWLMDLAIVELDPIWRDSPMTEYVIASEMVDLLKASVTQWGWHAPEFPSPVLDPVRFAESAWSWVWWMGPNLKIVSDPDRYTEVEMAMADAGGRH